MVKIYTTETCAYCRPVKEYLSSKGIDYQEVDVNTPELQKELYDLSGSLRFPTVKIGQDVVVGMDLSRLSKLLT